MGTRAVRVAALTLCVIMAASGGCAVQPPTPTAVVETTPTPTPRDLSITAILTDLSDTTVGIYGTRTKATFEVDAVGLALTYEWQQRPAGEANWKTIPKATSASYTAQASAWANGTQFRVIVTGTKGTVTSAVATLRVVKPTNTPAKDAEAAFGLTGLRQGVDLSQYQYPAKASSRVNLSAVRAWTGERGFAILRMGGGDRPINYDYTDVCTDKAGNNTGLLPATEDCAYRILAEGAAANGLSLGHYWFNNWISSADTSEGKVFAGDYTPADSARQFVEWLKRDGRYTPASTDPLVLDIEAGNTRAKTTDGTTQRLKLRHWRPSEAMEFLTTVRELLTRDGYQANLYVYMSAKTVVEWDLTGTGYAWAPVADIARLWVASWGIDTGGVPDAQPPTGPWAAHGGWSIWQYTSQARIAGSQVTNLDGDLAKADAWTPK